MTVAAQADFVSIGQLACRLQCSVRQLEAAAQELDMPAAMRIDHRPFYSADQVEQLANYLCEGSPQ